MKTNLRLKELGIVLVLLLSTFIFSCTKDVPSDIAESDLTLKSAAIPQPDDQVCDLIAGQTINVGKVVYSHVGNTMLVEYITTGGWTLSEVHLYVGNMDHFKETCMNNTAVQIGNFPYSATNLNSTTKSFEIDLTGIVPDANGYLVVAHAVVNKPGQEETAFANCIYQPVVIALKSNPPADAVAPFNTFACTEGTRFIETSEFENSHGWCYWLGYNIYNKGDGVTTYLLQSPDFPTPGDLGKVEVTDDGTSLFVTVYAENGYTIRRSYLYVGTMEGLQNTVYGMCPDYVLFPYKIEQTATVHAFAAIPLQQNSVSFEEAFGSKRWGWISYYNI